MVQTMAFPHYRVGFPHYRAMILETSGGHPLERDSSLSTLSDSLTEYDISEEVPARTTLNETQHAKLCLVGTVADMAHL